MMVDVKRCVVLVGLVAVTISATLGAQQRVEARREIAPNGTVSIDVPRGSIRVVAWERDEVRVTGTVDHRSAALELSGRGSRVMVEIDVDRGSAFQVDAHLEIRVPRTSRVIVETHSGGIEISGVEGRVTAESVSGSVDVDGSPTEISVETVSGSIRLDVATERTYAGSVSGSISVRGARGVISAESVSGRIDVRGDEFRRASLESNSGQLRFAGSLDASGSFEFYSHSGTVVLQIPDNVRADFDISTYSGSIINGFGQRAQRTSEHGPGRELRFSINGGGADVVIETFSGTVRLIKQ